MAHIGVELFQHRWTPVEVVVVFLKVLVLGPTICHGFTEGLLSMLEVTAAFVIGLQGIVHGTAIEKGRTRELRPQTQHVFEKPLARALSIEPIKVHPRRALATTLLLVYIEDSQRLLLSFARPVDACHVCFEGKLVGFLGGLRGLAGMSFCCHSDGLDLLVAVLELVRLGGFAYGLFGHFKILSGGLPLSDMSAKADILSHIVRSIGHIRL